MSMARSKRSVLGEGTLELSETDERRREDYILEEEKFMLKGENLFCVTPKLRL